MKSSWAAWISVASLLLAAADLPSAEFAPVLRLTARGSFEEKSARAGDTVHYRLRVEWREVPSAVMLLPRDELDAPGFRPAGLSTVHRKSAGPEGILNVTEFTYALIPREAGTARVAPFALRYHNGLTGREESVTVPGALFEASPARKPFAPRAGLALAAFVLAILAGVAVWMFRRRQRRPRRARAASLPGPFAAEIEALQRRCDRADSRAWLADAEALCKAYLCRRLGVSHPAGVRFEAALDSYLTRRRGLAPAEGDGWTTLRDLFHEARYAGGRHEPHVLHEACRHMKNCLRNEETLP